jgi:hypothetical protein
MDFPNFNNRAAILGFSEEGVFIRSMRRAIAASKSNREPLDKYIAVVSQLEQAQRRIEMSSAYLAGLKGEKHPRIATANSLHADIAACIDEIAINFNA